ncbi:MAG: MMPL family transporter [Acidimicrobiales bacterium]
MRALATWCVRHRRFVVLAWLGALVAMTAISSSVGSAYSNSFSLPHTPSTEAIQLLEAVSPRISGDTEQIVFETSGGQFVTSPAVKARVNSILARVRRLSHVTQIVSPYEPFVKTARSADATGLAVAVSGQLAEAANPTAIGGVGLGVILAGLVLLLVFGSIFAMMLPLISATASLGTAAAVIGLLSHVMTMPMFAPELVLLIGLGVGVDYALFIVTRYRQGLLAGHDVESSIVNSVNTSGRAVLFAGIIVCIALLGMFALGVSFLYGVAVAASIGVAFTMVAALTLLPALLGFIGSRALSRRQKASLAKDGPRIVGQGRSGFWPRWAGLVQGRPLGPALTGLAIIVLLALPFFSIQLGTSDQGSDPVGTTTRQAYDMLASGFGPGFNGPLQLVAVDHGTINRGVLAHLVASVAAQPDVARVAPPVVIPADNGTEVALIVVYPATSPQAVATSTLIGHLRQSTIPSVVAGSGISVYVGGTTALFVDFASVLSAKLPLFVGLVVLMSFLLLAFVFRSIVIPLVAAAMNLLSIGAAFGILVAVFSWGWLGAVFGVSRPGPIEAFLPVMLFAIVFGLSMDYEVFLVTRIHEEWLKSGDNRVAVRNALAATGKTITAAALIMILVFGSFMLGGQRVIQEFGLGLAGGILVDAVVIRMAIVPSIMQLLGRSNWWFPKRLDRALPRLAIEPDELLAGTLPGVVADEPVAMLS